MKNRIILGLCTALLCPLAAWAQAGTDCKDQVDQAVKYCADGIALASNGDLGPVNAAGQNNQGLTLASVTARKSTAIGAAETSCQKNAQRVCLQQCKAAIDAANSSKNSALANAAIKNRQDCISQIGDLLTKADGDRGTLDVATGQSLTTASCASGASDCVLGASQKPDVTPVTDSGVHTIRVYPKDGGDWSVDHTGTLESAQSQAKWYKTDGGTVTVNGDKVQ